MAKVMMTVRHPGGSPTLEAVREKLGLSEAEVDSDFGVVEVDPEEGIYTVRVDAQAASRVEPGEGDDYQGPYSDPHIAPFGPPQT